MDDSDRASVEVPALGAFDCHSGQDSGAVGASVEPDAIAALVDAFRNGMAMHHHEAMIGGIVEERVADPAQILFRLCSHRKSRPDSGMDEQIIAESKVSAKLARKSWCSAGIAALMSASAAASLLPALAAGDTP